MDLLDPRHNARVGLCDIFFDLQNATEVWKVVNGEVPVKK
jgi:hypothetical protein